MKITNPYLTIINKNTKYNPESFKDFEYEKVAIAMGDWGKKYGTVEKQTYTAYLEAEKELAAIGGKCTLNSAGRTGFDQVFAKIEKFAGVLKNSKSIKLAINKTKSETAKIGYSEHLSSLALDIKIETENLEVPEKIKQRFPEAGLGELKFLTKRMIMEKHGFILSYPTSPRLEEATGIKNAEGWHWRYITPEHSQRIAKIREKVTSMLGEKQEVFLEDYIQLLEHDVKSENEHELIEEYSNLFITQILKRELNNEVKL